MDKKKRGRKAKQEVHVSEPPEEEAAMPPLSEEPAKTEDENIIVQLQVGPVAEEVMLDPYEEQPVAYNRDVYMNIPNVSDMQCTGCNVTCPDASLKVVYVLQDFEQKNKNKEWPMNTSIACYWCCHRFDCPPVGIPISYVETTNTFEVFGCFCSLECAAAHNFKSNDAVDEVWERNSLINLLGRRLGINRVIKPAPDRMCLKMFGGFMEIDQFRNYTGTYKVVNVNFPPMISLTQQIEEINEYELNPDLKFIPIDHERINKCKEKMVFKRSKPVLNEKTTIESSMSLKIAS